MLARGEICSGLGLEKPALSSGSALSAEVRGVRAIIQKVVDALKHGSLKEKASAVSISGVLQTLRNISCETKLSLLETDLWKVIKQYRHNPELQPIVLHLLTGLANSGLALAEKASHTLAVLEGKAGNTAELFESALLRFSEPNNHLTLVGALSFATAGGKLARLALSTGIKRAGLSAGSALLAKAGGGAGIIGLESCLFSTGHVITAGVLGEGFNFSQLGEQTVHGAEVMSVLGVMGAISKHAYRVVHGVRGLNTVTRFHRVASFNRRAFSLLGEGGGLLAMNRHTHPETTWAYSVLSAGETMVGLRTAHVLRSGLLPGLESSLSILDAKAHEAFQQRSFQTMAAIRSSMQAFFTNSKGPNASPGLRWAYQASGTPRISEGSKAYLPPPKITDSPEFHNSFMASRKSSSRPTPAPRIGTGVTPRRPVVKDLASLPQLPRAEELEIASEEGYDAFAEEPTPGSPRIGHAHIATALGTMVVFTTPGQTYRPSTNADAAVWGFREGKEVVAAVFDGIGANDSASASGSGAIAFGKATAEGKKLGPSSTQAHKAIKRGGTTEVAFSISTIPDGEGFYEGEAAHVGDSRLLITRPVEGSEATEEIIFHNRPDSEWARFLGDHGFNEAYRRELAAHAARVGRPGEEENPLVWLNYSASHGIPSV